MSNNEEAVFVIKNWVKSGCNYNDGCVLYSAFGKNKTLARLFPGRQERYETKLKYELLKSVGLSEDFHKMNNSPQLVIHSKIIVLPSKKEEEHKENIVDEDSLPESVKKVTAEYSRLIAIRTKIHDNMSAVEGNDEESVNARKHYSDQLESLSSNIEMLHAAKEAYYNDKVLPDLIFLFPEEPAADKSDEQGELKLPGTLEGLNKMKINLQNSLSKDRNWLDYQSETKLESLSPMPDGPKKIKIEKRIDKKMKVIEAIELKLVEIAG